MTPDDIEDLITTLGGLVEILRDAKPEDRQNVYRQLGIRLTYHPAKQEIRVEVTLHPDQLSTDKDHYPGVTVGVRGGT
jgi:site-specific DNA recombinase